MKYVIIGRSASGKSTLAKKLEKLGMKVVRSYATTKPRSEDDDSHIFISKEEAKTFKDKLLTAKFGEREYFCTKEQVLEGQVFTLDMG